MDTRIVPTQNVHVEPQATPAPKRVEPSPESVAAIAAAANGEPDANKTNLTGRDSTDRPIARAVGRPLGTDPSLPPQSLFDAALISSEFKAQFELPTDNNNRAAQAATQDSGHSETVAIPTAR